MTVTSSGRRHAAHLHGGRDELPAPSKPGNVDRDNRYAVLMKVSVRHDYYNNSDERCPDFDFVPTNESAALMRQLGLIFRPEGTGFSILYGASQDHRQRLIHYLSRQGTDDGPCGVWTRLSIVLICVNPYFANITRLPGTSDPALFNFYFSNRSARGDGAIAYLNLEPTCDNMLRIAPSQYAVHVGECDRGVEVLDVSGSQVQYWPRCVSNGPVDGASLTRSDVPGKPLPKKPRLKELTCLDWVYLDFSRLPKGKYSVRCVPATPASSPEAQLPLVLLNTISAPQPFAFIDLFFTDPAGGDPERGCFPVTGLCPTDRGAAASAPQVTGVEYELWFSRRATQWRYFIVPLRRGSPVASRIQVDAGAAAFVGPFAAAVPNTTGGETPAQYFCSVSPLSLHALSPYRLALKGARPDMQVEQTLVAPLPVPSPSQVTPQPPPSGLGSRPRPDPADPCRQEDYLFVSDLYVYV